MAIIGNQCVEAIVQKATSPNPFSLSLYHHNGYCFPLNFLCIKSFPSCSLIHLHDYSEASVKHTFFPNNFLISIETIANLQMDSVARVDLLVNLWFESIFLLDLVRFGLLNQLSTGGGMVSENNNA